MSRPLPDGVTFSNGVFSGIPAENLSTTTYTIWANNSGGTSSASINLTVDQPFYVARYPVTILVLNVSENMPVLAPVYYFDDESNPVWSIEPALPAGLMFSYVDPTIEDIRNQTALEEEPPETIFPEPEEENIAYWLCPLILIIVLWLTAMIYNARNKNDEVEIADKPESEAKSE